MKSRTLELEKHFRKEGGILKFTDILLGGFHPDSLYALIKEGKVRKISRGTYALSAYDMGRYPDLAAVAIRAPRAVVCLVSALYFHEVTAEIPSRIDLAIPVRTHAYRIKYPPVRFYRFDRKSWEAGITEMEVKGLKIRVYNLAKTLADCFKFRNKIGADVAREALKTALSEKKVKPQEIMRYAAVCRVDKIVKPLLEALL